MPYNEGGKIMNSITKNIFNVRGMICSSCERKIEKALKNTEGVKRVKVDYLTSKVCINYDESVIKIKQITQIVEELGYNMVTKEDRIKEDKRDKIHTLGIGIIIFSIYVLIKNTIGFNFIPQVEQSMNYGILFIVGLLTSIHCIAMCGGINMSQCISYQFSSEDTRKLVPSLLYNTGRIISYTVIGGMAGALGSVVSFSGQAKGTVAIVAGIFMMIMGLNMLNIFPELRKMNIRMPKFCGNKIYNNNGRYGPLYIGLLNGLMPCGPLQTMQLYALGTGSFIKGAVSMFVFSLGTAPLMFGFGAMSALLSSKYNKKMLKLSALLVIFLGFIMAQRGLSLSGSNISLSDLNIKNINSDLPSGKVAKLKKDIQEVEINVTPWGYEEIVIQKGIPVKFTIHADESSLNGCNDAVIIPKYNIQKGLEPGINTIEFTPQEEGDIPYSCWMGMIRSNIKVVSNFPKGSKEENKDLINEELFLEQEYLYKEEQNFNGTL